MLKVLKRNLPNEHGGWVLLAVSIGVGESATRAVMFSSLSILIVDFSKEDE